MKSSKKNTREILSWAMFDVANSSYTTIIITVAYTVIFTQLIVGKAADNSYETGNLLWSIILSISNILSAFLAPLIGTLSDYSISKKSALAATVGICALCSCGLYFVAPGMVFWASILIIVSNIAFNLSESVISSFLPHITEKENIGRVSGLAWGLGYFGGLLSIVLCFVITGLEYSHENYSKLSLIGPITGLFFVIFAIPTFLFVRSPKNIKVSNSQGLTKKIIDAYKEILRTVKKLQNFKDLALFLCSFFFFQGGLAIVISFAAIYGMQVIGLEGLWQMIFFISLQLSASLGAFVFGVIQHKLGMIKTLNMTLFIWMTTILGIYFINDIAAILGVENVKVLFIVVGNLAGLCIGATQSLARSIVGVFSPPEHSGEFFGFWGFAGKLAAVFSLLVFGGLQKVFSLETGILICSSFFIIGLFINIFVDEKRGAAASFHS